MHKFLPFLIPLLIFSMISAIFWHIFHQPPPSNNQVIIVDKTPPTQSYPPLENIYNAHGQKILSFDLNQLKGKIIFINIWASWCIPCRIEMPELMQLAKTPKLILIGLNYKDDSENARRFLYQFGQPFNFIGTDPNGRRIINWGVYGIPESFLIAPDGKIKYHFLGPITAHDVKHYITKINNEFF